MHDVLFFSWLCAQHQWMRRTELCRKQRISLQQANEILVGTVVADIKQVASAWPAGVAIRMLTRRRQKIRVDAV